VRALAASASAIVGIDDGQALDLRIEGGPEAKVPPGGTPKRSRGRIVAPEATGVDGGPGEDVEGDSEVAGPARAPAAERRRAAEALISLWTDVARDIALCQRGLERSVRDLGLLDDVRGTASDVDPDALHAFIDQLGRAAVLVAGNASPELVLDDLALAWPRPMAGTRVA
jgi:hypothetical protein